MRGFLLATLLAGAHGIGDTSPDSAHFGLGDQGQLIFFGSPQAATPWDKGQCATGTKQSPINVATGSATVPTADPGAPTLIGHDAPQAFTPQASTYALTLYPSSTPISPATSVPSQPIMVSGGPFDPTRR